MTRQPTGKPLAWGAFGRPRHVWMKDSEQITYCEGSYEYED